MYNHNKAQQSKNRVHISWDILYSVKHDIHMYVFHKLHKSRRGSTQAFTLTPLPYLLELEKLMEDPGACNSKNLLRSFWENVAHN